MALKVGDYKTDVHNDWCPGCGDFGIVNSIQMALAEMEIPRHETAIFSGVLEKHLISSMYLVFILCMDVFYLLHKAQKYQTQI